MLQHAELTRSLDDAEKKSVAVVNTACNERVDDVVQSVIIKQNVINVAGRSSCAPNIIRCDMC